MQKWKKGSATTIFGMFIMILCTTMCMYFVQSFQIQQAGQDAQLAVDSIADSTAVYTSNHASDYDEARRYAMDMKQKIQTKTGTEVNHVTVDRNIFEEEDAVKVSLDVEGRLTNVTAGFTVNNEENPDSILYKIKTHATTKFNSNGLKDFQSTLRWLEESIPYAEYSNSIRTGYTEDGHIKSADCSSMCYMAYQHMGFTNIGSYPWTTETMADTYFYQIDKSELKPGDCIVARNGSFPGEVYGHAMLYVDDGICFEMGGQNGGLGYLNMPRIAPDGARLGYHCYRLKPEYANQVQ